MNAERELENHNVRIETLERRVDSFDAHIVELNKNLSRLNNALEQSKGGWKVMLILGSIIVALATIIHRILDYFK
jgi:hypothetical protein